MSLSWTDQSDDETGFKIQTKTTVKGSWKTIETLSSNVTSTNITASERDNWYRILSTNSHGDSITSNEIVARLVGNGLSYDYASKVKNKIVESLNEKFVFITGSTTPFINISKSSQDKRIQTLRILKY